VDTFTIPFHINPPDSCATSDRKYPLKVRIFSTSYQIVDYAFKGRARAPTHSDHLYTSANVRECLREQPQSVKFVVPEAPPQKKLFYSPIGVTKLVDSDGRCFNIINHENKRVLCFRCLNSRSFL